MNAGDRVQVVYGTNTGKTGQVWFVRHDGRLLVSIDGISTSDGLRSYSPTQVKALAAPTPTPPPPTGTIVESKTFGTLVPTNNTTYRNCSIGWINPPATAQNIRIEGGKVGGFDLCGTNLVFKNVEIGNLTDVHPAIAGPGITRNLLIEDCVIHDVRRTNSDEHTEGLQFGACDGATIRRTRFYNNAVFNTFLRCWDNRGIQNITFEDCDFGPTHDVTPTSRGVYAARVAGDDEANTGGKIPTNVIFLRCKRPRDQGISIDQAAKNRGCKDIDPIVV